MPTSLANLVVKDSSHELIVKPNDITIDGSSILNVNNFVTLDTNQNITGQKSFYTSQHLNGSTLHINSSITTLYPIQSHCRYSEIETNASIPTTTNVELGYDLFLAADGSMVTRLLPQILTNGKTVFRIQTRKTVNNTEKNVQIIPTIESNGTSYIDTYGVVLGQSDNSTKLATTNWVQTMMHESSIQLKSTNIDKTTTLSEDTWANSYYLNYDKNSSRTFFMQMRQFTNDAIGCRLCVQNGDPSSSTQYYTNLDLIAYKNQSSPQITSAAHFDITNYIAAITGPVNFVAQNNSIEKGVTPSTSNNLYAGYDIRCKNGDRQVYLGVAYKTNGTKHLELQKLDTNLTDFDATSWLTKVAHPTISSNTNDVVTTYWHNQKHQVVSALPANPDANVFYYIPA